MEALKPLEQKIVGGKEKKLSKRVEGRSREDVLQSLNERKAELEAKAERSETDERELSVLRLKLEILTNLSRGHEQAVTVRALQDGLANKEEMQLAPSRMLLYGKESFSLADVLAAYRWLIQELDGRYI